MNERLNIESESSIRNERLNHLIDVLKNIDEVKSFDMKAWYTPTLENECGFAACALGWAAMDPTFIEMGLELSSSSYLEGGKISRKHTPTFTNENGMKWHDPYTSAARLFKISEMESVFIFYPDSYYLRQGKQPFGVDREDLFYDDTCSRPFISINKVLAHIEFVRDNPSSGRPKNL
jgi:hypothetical protein